MTNSPNECNLDNIINLLTLKSPSTTTCNIDELRGKLVDYLIDKLIKDQEDLKKCLKAVLKKKLEISNENINNICGKQLDVFSNITKDVPSPLSTKNYTEFLSKIKKNYEEVYKKLGQEDKRKVNTARFLFDTCYDENRAANLKEDIEKILNVLNNNKEKEKTYKGKKCSLITLLATAYIGAASSFEVNRDMEWMLELLRTFLLREKERNKEKRNIEFTLCPSKGDAAAVTYYAVLCLKECNGEKVNVDRELITDLVSGILSHSGTSKGSIVAGSGSGGS